MIFGHVRRGGRYCRVCDPSWSDPSDTSYSRRCGGRWNPPDRRTRPGFGALYMNATVDVARANARRHARASFGVELEDLADSRLPDLQWYDVVAAKHVDAVSARGIRMLELPADYPRIPHAPCRQIAERAYAQNEHGIAALSAERATDEELVVFDRDVLVLTAKRERDPFAKWF